LVTDWRLVGARLLGLLLGSQEHENTLLRALMIECAPLYTTAYSLDADTEDLSGLGHREPSSIGC